MIGFVRRVRARLARDPELGLRSMASKGVQFALARATAPVRLRAFDRTGPGARTVGTPHVENRGYISVGAGFNCASVYAPVELVTAPGGRIEIGDRVFLNYATSVTACALVRIGDDVHVGPHTIIWDSEDRDHGDARPIEVGNRVWLAGRVTLLPGARVGDDSVITAGSIVSGEIPAGVVAGGVPARVFRRIAEGGAGRADSVPA